MLRLPGAESGELPNGFPRAHRRVRHPAEQRVGVRAAGRAGCRAGGDTTLPGVLYDTGRGYPAFVLERFPPRPSREPAERGVPAEVYRLRDPRSALPVLDDYEGPEYERLVLDLDAERSCWVYVWRPPVEGMRRIFGGWTESCRQHPRDG
ncbi:gamma-glutamylcyclotransferase family protein [Actinopolyspora saharensis]|uniref:gamma-glutamylcyclotransferase family protein n=1 Tax=Actinopolyspora saharensis TaxID=995062 RepID=UPI000B8540AF|nr:gamma-glutamylcyclotransferase family protein [Actinopolyspora saharensis]